MSENKRGRPVKETARRRIINIRLTEEEYDMLDKISFKTGLNKSNIIRAAVRVYYNLRFQ